MSKFNAAVDGKEGVRREPFYVADKHSMSLEHFYIPAHYQDTLGGLMIPSGAIHDRIEKLAYDITHDYNGQTIHMICVLKGKILITSRLCLLNNYDLTYSRWRNILC